MRLTLKPLQTCSYVRNCLYQKSLLLALTLGGFGQTMGTTTWLHDSDERFSFAGHIEAFRQIVKTGAFRKVLAATSSLKSPVFGHETIGTFARIDGTGFRKDGSSLYPPKVFLEFMETPVYVDRESPSIIDRIRMARREFSLPAVIDEKRVNLIVKALSSNQKKRSGGACLHASIFNRSI